MNAMDIYDFGEGGHTTSPPASSGNVPAATAGIDSQPATRQPSLNEEVQQALGSLGSWWGGFRKQSAVALASARKDLGQVVQQAQREIGKLTTQPTSLTSPRASTSSTAGPTNTETASSAADAPADINQPEVLDATAVSDPATTTSSAPAPSSPTTASALFSFLPANLAQNLISAPTNIQTTLQRTLSNPEIQQLRSSLTTNLSTLQSTVQSTVQSSVHSVQSNPQVQTLASSVQSLPSTVSNLNVKAVEGFVIEKGEEFWKGAEEFFRDAVKIVPPSEEELRARGMSGSYGVGAGVFDGAGVWVFEDLGGDGGEEKGADEEGEGKGKAIATTGVAVSRTAALLKQLRGDPTLLRVDPLGSGDGKGAETFAWFLKELEGKGASVGSEAWIGKCAGEEGMFEELKATKETLVPAEMDETTFWKRYWFRAWQIREAEEKRRALLQSTTTIQKEEDFTWEDEEEDTAADKTETQTPLNNSTPTLSMTVPDPAGEPGEKKSGPGAGSPRESSEDSYDLVSTRSGNASGTALAVPGLASVLERKEEEKKKQEKKEGEEEDSGDSDWE